MQAHSSMNLHGKQQQGTYLVPLCRLLDWNASESSDRLSCWTRSICHPALSKRNHQGI